MKINDIKVKLYRGDCLDVLKLIPDNRIHASVTDPPYGLEFMGNEWDHGVPGVLFWEQVLRVLRPGAYLLSFGGTRTYHRLTCAIEDAGFEIVDCLSWMYGSGFPKSHNIGKKLTEWSGWGTALKPAWEPIILARRPKEGTYVDNVLKYGTGGMHIDACRIKTDDNLNGGTYSGEYREKTTEWQNADRSGGKGSGLRQGIGEFKQPSGRWPANVILDEEAGNILDRATGVLKSGTGAVKKKSSKDQNGNTSSAYGRESRAEGEKIHCYGDSGGASRFFYCAKASKKERTCNGKVENKHPTVKPIALMRYLVRLITPPNGIVLDPFMGSGSTGIAAVEECFKFIGIDKDKESYDTTNARMLAWDYGE